jgi:hypothetical protein
MWKYVEIMQHSTGHQKCVLSYFRPEVEIEHSSTQATIYFPEALFTVIIISNATPKDVSILQLWKAMYAHFGGGGGLERTKLIFKATNRNNNTNLF